MGPMKLCTTVCFTLNISLELAAPFVLFKLIVRLGALNYYLPWPAKNRGPKSVTKSVCQTATFIGWPAKPCNQNCQKTNLNKTYNNGPGLPIGLCLDLSTL